MDEKKLHAFWDQWRFQPKMNNKLYWDILLLDNIFIKKLFTVNKYHAAYSSNTFACTARMSKDWRCLK